MWQCYGFLLTFHDLMIRIKLKHLLQIDPSAFVNSDFVPFSTKKIIIYQHFLMQYKHTCRCVILFAFLINIKLFSWLQTSGTLTYIPLVLFGVVMVIGGTLACFLPETHKKPLPETIEEIEYGTKKSAPVTENTHLWLRLRSCEGH